MNWSYVFPVADSSGVAAARREICAMARRIGFEEIETGRIALVVAEAGGNLIKHTRGGELVVRELNGNGPIGLEILALDEGPGIANLGQALRDGFSTAGTPGTGLGAMQRLSQQFDIQSSVELGTALLARFWRGFPQKRPPVSVGAICCAKVGEQVCGDAWDLRLQGARCLIVLVDGLGHGQLASDASIAALRSFAENDHRSPAEIIRAAGDALRTTRGAAMAVAELDTHQRSIRYCGVGNIAGVVVLPDDRRQSLVSMNGTVGQPVQTIREFSYSYPEGSIVILHSDGLSSHWDLDAYRGVTGRDPGVVAGLLYRDHKRNRDDVTVVVTRQCTDEMPKDEDQVNIHGDSNRAGRRV